jgi:hypothetical protein
MLTLPLKNFVNEFVDYVDGVKAGRDVSNIKTSLMQKLQNFVDTMTTLNSQWWTNISQNASQYMAAYGANVLDQVTFRKAGKWSEDIDAYNVASNIIANGPVYQSPFNGSSDFATVLANSIVRQFPEKFS